MLMRFIWYILGCSFQGRDSEMSCKESVVFLAYSAHIRKNTQPIYILQTPEQSQALLSLILDLIPGPMTLFKGPMFIDFLINMVIKFLLFNVLLLLFLSNLSGPTFMPFAKFSRPYLFQGPMIIIFAIFSRPYVYSGVQSITKIILYRNIYTKSRYIGTIWDISADVNHFLKCWQLSLFNQLYSRGRSTMADGQMCGRAV